MRPILIAEDERPIADLIELTLTGAGYAGPGTGAEPGRRRLPDQAL